MAKKTYFKCHCDARLCVWFTLIGDNSEKSEHSFPFSCAYKKKHVLSCALGGAIEKIKSYIFIPFSETGGIERPLRKTGNACQEVDLWAPR